MGILDGVDGLRAYLDTNFFIYLAEGFAPAPAAVAKLATMIKAGDLMGGWHPIQPIQGATEPLRSVKGMIRNQRWVCLARS